MSHGSEHGSGKGFFGSMKEKFNKAKSAGKEWLSTSIGGNPENVTAEEKKNRSKDYVTTLGLGGEYDSEGKAVREKDETLNFRDSEKVFSGIRGKIGEVKDWAKKKIKEKGGIKMDRFNTLGKALDQIHADLGEVENKWKKIKDSEDEATNLNPAGAGRVQPDAFHGPENVIEPGDEWVNPYAENNDPGEDVQANEDLKPGVSAEKAENLESKNPALDRLAELIIRLAPLQEGNKQFAEKIKKQEWIKDQKDIDNLQIAVVAIEKLGLNKADKELIGQAKDLIAENNEVRKTAEELVLKFGADVSINQELKTKITTGAELSKEDKKSILGVIKQMFGLYPMGEDSAKMEKVKKYFEKNIS